MLQPAALQVGLELLPDMGRQVPIPLSQRRQEVPVVALHQLVEQRVFRTVPGVAGRPEPGRGEDGKVHARSVARQPARAPAGKAGSRAGSVSRRH